MTEADDVSTVDRIIHFVGSNVTTVLVACLLLAAVGGSLAYQSFTGPDTTTERQTVGTWTVDSEFRHAAVVQRDTRAFDEGAVLRNRSVYFTSVAPTLNGTHVVEHSGGAEPATAQTDLRLVVRAVEGGEDEGILWSVSEQVASERTQSLAPGEELAVPFRFNVTAQSELAERVRQEIGSSRGQAQVRLVADTEVSATVSGQGFDETRRDSLDVTPRADSYGVAQATTDERREQVRESVEVPVEANPVTRYGSLLVLVLGLAGAGAVAYLGRTGRLDIDSDTRAAIAAARDRNSFDEWISTGTVPPVADERVVTVDSLEDLVDVAIDSDRRVIEDSSSGTAVVLDGETRYEFSPKGRRGPLSEGVSASGSDPLLDGSETTADGHEPDGNPSES